MDAAHLAVLVGVGVGAGFLSALFGIGGGVVMVPALHYGLGYGWAHATAISLAAIAVTTPSGVLAHARRGAVDWRLAWPLAVGGLAGVTAGAWLQPRIEVPWLKLLFAGLMALGAWRMLRPALHARWHTRHPAFLLALGLACGVISKLLGIGGGLLSVPALALTGTAIRVAVGSSLVPVFTNAAFASASHLAKGVALLPGLALAAGGLLGVPFGARAAHRLPEAGLRRAFATALAAAAIAIAITSGAF
ncbi:MAG: sulfite exporter TauE/SafE family protein [Candidatus Thermoplasmatota archaeon]